MTYVVAIINIELMEECYGTSIRILDGDIII